MKARPPDWLRERRFWRTSADRDVDDELAFHLAMRAELLESSGLDPQSARDAALQRFGDVAVVRERCITISHERERRMKRLELWTALRQHLRHALRRLRAAPAFAGAVLVMLTLGIGAATAVFGVVDGILLRPLPFDRPDRLVALRHTLQVSGVTDVDQSDGTVMLYQRHATGAFENIGASQKRDVNLAAPGQSGAAERVAAAGVTVSLFPTLRVAPARGRAFNADDGRPGGGVAPVVMLSDAIWRSRFGGDPAIVGRRLIVDGVEREVVGVMPASFRYPTAETAVWYPLRFDPAHASPASFNYDAVARLRPGVTPEAATAELNRVLPRLLDEFPTS